MRTTVYGRQTLIMAEGKLLGINLGYNFYYEHEEGTLELVHNINRTSQAHLANKIVKQGCKDTKSIKFLYRLKKEIKKEEKIMQRYKNTPYGEYTISCSIEPFIRKIIIDNSKLKRESVYRNYLLNDGGYTLVILDNSLHTDYWANKIENKRKFCEGNFFYMEDYNNGVKNNPGYILRGKGANKFTSGNVQFAAAWGSSGLILLIDRQSDDTYNISESIEKAIKSGSLAIVPEQSKLFNDRGCCLILLDEAYKPR